MVGQRLCIIVSWLLHRGLAEINWLVLCYDLWAAMMLTGGLFHLVRDTGSRLWVLPVAI